MRVLRFTASWCGPCKSLSSMLDEINPLIPINTYDIDEDPNLAIDYGIRSVPTMIKLDGNTEVDRKIGLMSKKELETWLSKH